MLPWTDKVLAGLIVIAALVLLSVTGLLVWKAYQLRVAVRELKVETGKMLEETKKLGDKAADAVKKARERWLEQREKKKEVGE